MARTPWAPTRLSRMIAKAAAPRRPLARPSALSAKPSSCRPPVTSASAATTTPAARAVGRARLAATSQTRPASPPKAAPINGKAQATRPTGRVESSAPSQGKRVKNTRASAKSLNRGRKLCSRTFAIAGQKTPFPFIWQEPLRGVEVSLSRFPEGPPTVTETPTPETASLSEIAGLFAHLPTADDAAAERLPAPIRVSSPNRPGRLADWRTSRCGWPVGKAKPNHAWSAR